jgi:hypothetical protein
LGSIYSLAHPSLSSCAALPSLPASHCIATSFSPEPNEPNHCHSPVAISWHVRSPACWPRPSSLLFLVRPARRPFPRESWRRSVSHSSLAPNSLFAPSTVASCLHAFKSSPWSFFLARHLLGRQSPPCLPFSFLLASLVLARPSTFALIHTNSLCFTPPQPALLIACSSYILPLGPPSWPFTLFAQYTTPPRVVFSPGPSQLTSLA